MKPNSAFAFCSQDNMSTFPEIVPPYNEHFIPLFAPFLIPAASRYSYTQSLPNENADIVAPEFLNALSNNVI